MTDSANPTGPTQGARRGLVKAALKIVLSAGLLGLVLYKLDFGDLRAAAANMQWWAFPAALVGQIIAISILNLRWWLLLRDHQLGYRPRQLLPQYFIGSFFNNLLPTSTGGDIFRMYYIYRRQHGPAIAVSPVVTERLLGLVAMITLATTIVPFLARDSESLRILADILPWVFLSALLGLFTLGSRLTYRPIHRWFERWEHNRIIGPLLHIAEATHTYIRKPWLVIKILLLSVVAQAFAAGVYFCLGAGIGADALLPGYLVIVPVIFAIASLPITIGGLGVREAAVVSLFPAIGMSQADAGAVALFYIPVLLISTLPGLYWFLRMKDHKQFYANASHSHLGE